MVSRDLESWMWDEAAHVLDRADRLQRQFFQPGARRQAQWQPPVDIYETRDAVWVIIALPGVVPEHVTVEVRADTVLITGERNVPEAARRGVLHHLEIPHGRFERRLRLPFPRVRVARHELVDGCLYLQLRKTRGPL